MTKRVALSLAIAVIALLCSSAAFAAETPAPAKEVFLANLQPAGDVPAEASQPVLGNVPQPIFMAIPSCTPSCPCSYQCKKCTATSVKLCATNCHGATGCDGCQPGTICNT